MQTVNLWLESFLELPAFQKFSVALVVDEIPLEYSNVS